MLHALIGHCTVACRPSITIFAMLIEVEIFVKDTIFAISKQMLVSGSLPMTKWENVETHLQ